MHISVIMLQVCVATIKRLTNVQNVTVLAILEPHSMSGGAGVGDRTYKQIRGSGGGVLQIVRHTK